MKDVKEFKEGGGGGPIADVCSLEGVRGLRNADVLNFSWFVDILFREVSLKCRWLQT